MLCYWRDGNPLRRIYKSLKICFHPHTHAHTRTHGANTVSLVVMLINEILNIREKQYTKRNTTSKRMRDCVVMFSLPVQPVTGESSALTPFTGSSLSVTSGCSPAGTSLCTSTPVSIEGLTSPWDTSTETVNPTEQWTRVLRLPSALLRLDSRRETLAFDDVLRDDCPAPPFDSSRDWIEDRRPSGKL